jgi:hypothetical protein
MNSYITILQKALPVIKICGDKITYSLIYHEIKDYESEISISFTIKRLESNNNIIIDVEILLSLLRDQLRHIFKNYMGINKCVNVSLKESIEDFV